MQWGLRVTLSFALYNTCTLQHMHFTTCAHCNMRNFLNYGLTDLCNASDAIYKMQCVRWKSVRCNLDCLSAAYFLHFETHALYTVCTWQHLHLHFTKYALCNPCTLQHVHLATRALCCMCTLQCVHFTCYNVHSTICIEPERQISKMDQLDGSAKWVC